MPRPRSSIRDLVFLVVIVALLLGWVVERRRTERALIEAEMSRAIAAEERARAEAEAAQARAVSEALLASPTTP